MVARARFEFELPDLLEQYKIIRRVETIFAHADRLEARTAAARSHGEQLTPSLLASGSIVRCTIEWYAIDAYLHLVMHPLCRYFEGRQYSGDTKGWHDNDSSTLDLSA